MLLYHTPRAPNPERVFLFLKAKGRLNEVELREISIMNQEHRSSEYRAISPFSQVPALVLDDDVVLTESRAICTYFEAEWPEHNLMGRDAVERGLIEMWDRRVELMFLLQFALWFRNGHPAMEPLETPQCEKTAEKGERNAKAFVKALDRQLSESPFIAGDRFTIADITAYVGCGFAGAMRWKPHRDHEHLGAWYDKLSGMPFAQS